MTHLLLLLWAALPDHPLGDDLPVSLAVAPPRRRQQDEPMERPPRFDPPPQASGGNHLSVSGALEMKFLSGRTKVREHDSRPEWLDLNGDLGFGEAPGFRVSLAWDTRRFKGFLEYESAQAGGEGISDHDFSYDEGEFKGGLPYETSVSIYFARAGLSFKRAFVDRPSVSFGFLVGLEYPRVSLGIEQPGSGESTSEQYDAFLPVPILGLEGELRLSSSLTISGRMFFGYVQDLPTPFTEGGRLSMSVETFTVEASLNWQITASLRFTLGVGYQYWSGQLHSVEDGNQLTFSAPQVTIGLELRW